MAAIVISIFATRETACLRATKAHYFDIFQEKPVHNSSRSGENEGGMPFSYHLLLELFIHTTTEKNTTLSSICRQLIHKRGRLHRS